MKTGVIGPLITQAWADRIGADIYASDTDDSVSKAKAALLNNSTPETHISAD